MSRIIAPFLLFFVTGFCFNTYPIQDIPTKLIPATVEISVKEKKDDSFIHSGTGWLYNNQTTVVTAKHVIDGFDDIVKKPDGSDEIKHTPYSAIRVTFSDGQQIVINNLIKSKKYDVAVLTFDIKTIKIKRKPLMFAIGRPKVGENLFGAGFPFDYECLLLTGCVTGYHTEKIGDFTGEYLVTNAMFAPGNSGGPIVNAQGDVIGMVDWIDRRSPALSFAIPSDVIKKAIDE